MPTMAAPIFENTAGYKPPPPQSLTIPSKPNAPISYTFIPSSSKEGVNTLIVFISGLGAPSAAWLPCISILKTTRQECPAILTYDRFGQGETKSRDPLDGTPGKENGHDFLDVASDLHEIITVVTTSKLGINLDQEKFQLLLIGASIGVPILRLYAQHHPGLVAGAIFLDSNICNVDYSDIWPDPDAPGFDPKTVIAEDCTLMQYRGAREAITQMFDLKVKNAEGLDRVPGARLLPLTDEPKLIGPNGKGSWLRVVGHDPKTFAEDSLKRMGTPLSCSNKFTNPYWMKYNQRLTKLTDRNVEDAVIAKGCSHFIQLDDPAFVANEVTSMLEKLEME